jgi:cytochrome c biogenesis protein CcdA
MIALLGLVASIALADSINPSTVLPALYYATSRRPRVALASFALGVLVVAFAGGLVVLVGGRELVQSVLPDPGRRTTAWLEVGGGVLLLAISASVRLVSERVADRVTAPPGGGPLSAAAVGAGIMAVELATALPYFAAIAAITASDAGLAAQVGLLAVYDLLFVLPVLAILAARAFAGERGDRVLQAMRGWTQRNAAAVLAATLAVIGVACVAVGAIGLA